MEGGIIIVESCALEEPESNASTLPSLLFYLHLIWTFSFHTNELKYLCRG